MIRLFEYVLTICFVLLQCTGRIAGGSETTNGVIVAVAQNDIKFTGPSGSNINIFSVDYMPSSNTGPVISLSLNDSGLATLNDFSYGIYNIFILNPSDSTMGLIDSVTVSKNENRFWDVRLELPGALSGKLIIANASTNGNAVIYIKGTPFIDTMGVNNSIAHFNFSRIPSGIYTIEYIIKDINSSAALLGERKGTLTTVAVKSNQVLNFEEPFRIP